jgi:hypothetical protein
LTRGRAATEGNGLYSIQAAFCRRFRVENRPEWSKAVSGRELPAPAYPTSHDGRRQFLIGAAGFMPAGPSNTVLLAGDAATAAGVGSTVEPASGSDTPSLPPVALVSFV